MAVVDAKRLSQLPDEMLTFTILKAGVAATPARLGRLCLHGKSPLQTPNYVAIASRGVIPHISPDNLRTKTTINGAYLALEDFIERPPHQVPIYQYQPPDSVSPLRSFCALPSNAYLFLGARRTPAVHSLRPNTAQSVTVWTSFGAREMQVQEYVREVVRLKPDIAIGLGDMLYGGPSASKTRVAKMGDRTEAWLSLLLEAKKVAGAKETLLFAPILPIEREQQVRYIEALEEQASLAGLQGLAVYRNQDVQSLPAQLAKLPRLAMTEPESPSDILSAVAVGADILTIPFISSATDAGIALTFKFRTSQGAPNSSTGAPLGIDLRDTMHALDTSPIQDGCTCYACATHHRAYVHHLLLAKEMLAWTLLQIHNLHLMDTFFAAIRESIAGGTFEDDVAAFEEHYEPELPSASGQGPRARGYQFKSEGLGEAKKNPKAYNTFEDADEALAVESNVNGMQVGASGKAS